jgi:hypothetical protein
MAQSFINNEELRHFDPGKGTANVEVLGRSRDGALDIGFSWDEGKVDAKPSAHHRHDDVANSLPKSHHRPEVPIPISRSRNHGGFLYCSVPSACGGLFK